MNSGMRLAGVVAGVCMCGAAVMAAKPPPPPPPVTTWKLASDNVRLEVDKTYAYRLYDPAGNTLLGQNQTSFTIDGRVYTASGISNITQTANSLRGTLSLVSGRKSTTANVTFTFASPDVLRVDLSRAAGLSAATSIGERFADQGERYYGVWEAAYGTGLDNRGVVADFDGKETLNAPVNNVFAASARAPFYLTSRNVGVYVESAARGHYSIADSTRNTSFNFESPAMTYHVMYAPTPKGVLGKYNALAGPALMPQGVADPAYMPPDWAFDTIWWRDDPHQLPRNYGVLASTATNAQELAIEDADRLRQYHIPASAIWFDRPYGTGSTGIVGWGNMDFDSSFPDPDKMVQDLSARGINTMLWIANRAANGMYTRGAAGGYLFPGTASDAPAADLRKTGAMTWFGGELNTLMDQALFLNGATGIKGFKIDRGGEGEMPYDAINQNMTLLDQTAYAAMQARNGQDFFNFTRNISDKGRRYAAVWSGDPDPTFAGMQTSVKNGLRSGLVNFPLWGSDTGGYRGDPTKEVFARWMGFSAYSPMMEVCQRGAGRNVWYNYDQQLIDITVKHTQTHHDLIPYTRSNVYNAVRTGVPVMRAMVLEYPTDPAVANMWDQYMYGPGLLVAPVMTQGATSRTVYLPAGRWMDYNNRTTIYTGGRTITAAAPLDTVPVFVREGAIIPRGDIVKSNNDWTPNWAPSLRIEVFPSDDFASSFDYFTGQSVVTITSTPQSDGFLIDFASLGLGGILDIYATQPTGIFGLDGLPVDYTYDGNAHLLHVPFAADSATWLDIDGARSLFGLAGLSAVPEPGTLAILALSALTLARRRRTMSLFVVQPSGCPTTS